MYVAALGEESAEPRRNVHLKHAPGTQPLHFTVYTASNPLSRPAHSLEAGCATAVGIPQVQGDKVSMGT